MTIRFAALGLDHRHIYGMAENLAAAGAQFAAWWTDGEPSTLPGFRKRFPNVSQRSKEAILDDPTIDVILIAAIPKDRAALAIAAMEANKHVMVDKPGCISRDQIDQIRLVQTRMRRIWAVNFSERFEVPAATAASQLVADGAIGRVVQTIGLGPHRLNIDTRPDWFFDRAAYGGILTDIASHQIDQFLHFTGATSAEITMAAVGNYANPRDPGLQDFGELALRAPEGHGYIRVDWYTPDALPTWGDGRLTILGTEGYIELRKYVDVGGAPGTDHLILVNGTRCEKIDASGVGLPWFRDFLDDLAEGIASLPPQDHYYTVTELAIEAQEWAEAAAR
ncbi:MAG: Gfo/Idh/MocA family oxidoreductase [Pseudomonadota bacterium]